MNNFLRIFGFGYTAKYLAKILPDNFKVDGSNTGTNENGFVFNPPTEVENLDFSEVTHILITIPPDQDGDLVYEYYNKQIMNEAKKLKWIGYISTTGVYGDYQGNWVDETSELRANDVLSLNRIKAENQWLEFGKHNANLSINIFRVAGIYGPNRSIVEKVINDNYKIIKKEGQYFSRIHVEDIANIILKTMANYKTEIYNLADDLPTSPEEPYLYLIQKLNKTTPEIYNFNEIALNDMLKHFFNSSKKVNNNKIKEILNIKLKYPSYQHGFDEILKLYQK
ncbi:MAG: NAD-dependent epimerase/dehydratase family protein [Sphingobacteriia bacterium]|nr:NAD-dependent epimerase/dehydratase family protein [Sphingobacteriia bacterium]